MEGELVPTEEEEEAASPATPRAKRARVAEGEEEEDAAAIRGEPEKEEEDSGDVALENEEIRAALGALPLLLVRDAGAHVARGDPRPPLQAPAVALSEGVTAVNIDDDAELDFEGDPSGPSESEARGALPWRSEANPPRRREPRSRSESSSAGGGPEERASSEHRSETRKEPLPWPRWRDSGTSRGVWKWSDVSWMDSGSINWSKYKLNDERLREKLAQLPGDGPLSFRVIDLSRNAITSQGFKDIVNVCKRCPRLRILKLYRNQLDDEVAQYFPELFQSCSTLVEVHLSHNCLTNASFEIIVKAADTNLSPPVHRRPVWLRMEKNNIVVSADTLKNMMGQFKSVCMMEDRWACDAKTCALNRQVHVPFLFKRPDAARWANGDWKRWSDERERRQEGRLEELSRRERDDDWQPGGRRPGEISPHRREYGHPRRFSDDYDDAGRSSREGGADDGGSRWTRPRSRGHEPPSNLARNFDRQYYRERNARVRERVALEDPRSRTRRLRYDEGLRRGSSRESWEGVARAGDRRSREERFRDLEFQHRGSMSALAGVVPRRRLRGDTFDHERREERLARGRVPRPVGQRVGRHRILVEYLPIHSSGVATARPSAYVARRPVPGPRGSSGGANSGGDGRYDVDERQRMLGTVVPVRDRHPRHRGGRFMYEPEFFEEDDCDSYYSYDESDYDSSDSRRVGMRYGPQRRREAEMLAERRRRPERDGYSKISGPMPDSRAPAREAEMLAEGRRRPERDGYSNISGPMPDSRAPAREAEMLAEGRRRPERDGYSNIPVPETRRAPPRRGHDGGGPGLMVEDPRMAHETGGARRRRRVGSSEVERSEVHPGRRRASPCHRTRRGEL